MATKKYAELGSVSSGTMITEDVFDSCIYALAQLDRKRAKEIQQDWDNIESECPDHRGDDCDNCNEARVEFLNETLWNALNEHAPAYCYFGANEGDGADYGFWISWDSVQEDVRSGEILQVSDLSEVPKKYRGLIIHINDHGNASLYSVKNGNFNEIWSVV